MHGLDVQTGQKQRKSLQSSPLTYIDLNTIVCPSRKMFARYEICPKMCIIHSFLDK